MNKYKEYSQYCQIKKYRDLVMIFYTYCMSYDFDLLFWITKNIWRKQPYYILLFDSMTFYGLLFHTFVSIVCFSKHSSFFLKIVELRPKYNLICNPKPFYARERNEVNA